MLARLSGAINSTFLDAVNVLLILAYFTYILRALHGALVCDCVLAVCTILSLFLESAFVV